MVFDQILREQLGNADKYLRTDKIPGGCISIKIKNGAIADVRDGNGFIHPERKKQYIQLVANCLNKHTIKDCNININLSDFALAGIFNFCRPIGSKNMFLLPNHRFTIDDVRIGGEDDTRFATFDEQREFIHNRLIPDKTHKIYTSVIPHPSKIAYFKYALVNQDICDGYCYIGSIHKQAGLDSPTADALARVGMCGGWNKPWSEHLKYSYLLYNDGNSLSDRMRLLLCTDSVILRKKSIYEEFYTYLLRDGINYIEYKQESELREIIEHCEADYEIGRSMAAANKKFVCEFLTYTNILKYCADLINGIC